MEKTDDVFSTLNAINVNDFTEKKGNLTYLSWCNAWGEVKKRYPDANYTVTRYENDLPYVFDPNTGYMVSTTVTINGLTHSMWLPVMDYRNQAIIQNATMTDINKTIMRCLTKNLAMFGLGLYIYKGEDLPDDSGQNEKAGKQQQPSNESGAKEKESPRRNAVLQLWEARGQDPHNLQKYVYKRTGILIDKRTTDGEWADILDLVKNDNSLRK